VPVQGCTLPLPLPVCSNVTLLPSDNFENIPVLSHSIYISNSRFMADCCGEEALLTAVIYITKCQIQETLSVLRTNFTIQVELL
jgi:hypothetical protein